MGSDLVAKLIPYIERMEWPSNQQINEVGIRAFDIALDEVDSYRNDPKPLQKALLSLQTGGCEPLCYAGIAYTLVAASEEKEGTYAQEGLDEAMKWLEKAQAITPDVIDINFIEALVYVYSDRFEDARLVLDYLQEQSTTDNYRLLVTESILSYRIKDLEGLTYWTDLAGQAAANVPQRLRLIGRVADAFLEAEDYDNALEQYKKAIHFDKDNPALWHKVSLIHWRLENYEEAQRYNQQVLKLDPRIKAAQKMSAALKEKLGQDDEGGNALSRLFKR
ncbi:MAG: tetratricopeptide repeat protein [Anaerolineales bacterium]|nr:tetratricopeptide repeat protein [Anaerolineales bacterium]